MPQVPDETVVRLEYAARMERRAAIAKRDAKIGHMTPDQRATSIAREAKHVSKLDQSVRHWKSRDQRRPNHSTLPTAGLTPRQSARMADELATDPRDLIDDD